MKHDHEGFFYLHDVFDSTDEPDVVFDELGELEELCRGLVVVDVSHLLLDRRHLSDGGRQARVLLRTAQHRQRLAEN